jgi:hypothetical protein
MTTPTAMRTRPRKRIWVLVVQPPVVMKWGTKATKNYTTFGLARLFRMGDTNVFQVRCLALAVNR